MAIRLIMVALALVLLGSSMRASDLPVDAQSVQLDADAPVLDALPAPAAAVVVPAPRIVLVVAHPPAVDASGRLHVLTLLRPPRA